MTAIRSASADMMSRKVRRGDGVLGCALIWEDKRGKKRGGQRRSALYRQRDSGLGTAHG
jgi:hypothetical protein